MLWTAVLGNHDYRGNALAQLSPLLKQKDSRWVCLKSFILDAGKVHMNYLVFLSIFTAT